MDSLPRRGGDVALDGQGWNAWLRGWTISISSFPRHRLGWAFFAWRADDPMKRKSERAMDPRGWLRLGLRDARDGFEGTLRCHQTTSGLVAWRRFGRSGRVKSSQSQARGASGTGFKPRLQARTLFLPTRNLELSPAAEMRRNFRRLRLHEPDPQNRVVSNHMQWIPAKAYSNLSNHCQTWGCPILPLSAPPPASSSAPAVLRTCLACLPCHR